MSYNSIEGADMVALMPCPLKVPFEELFNSFMKYYQEQKSIEYSCFIESNANNDLDFFNWVRNCNDIDKLPNIMIAPGFSYFFHREFREKFGDAFAGGDSGQTGMELQKTGLPDPQNRYYIPCFNPTVMVVDRTVYSDLPIPRRWVDLLKPEYTRQVALRGHQGGQFCEGLFMNIYREKGEEGVIKLGKAAKTGLHPSQMVKFAGSGKKDAPAISTLPYSFSKMVRTNEKVSIVWPEDGAIINPFVMIVKKSAMDRVKDIVDFITGKEVGQAFASAYFPASHRDAQIDLPRGATFKWLGWDFINENDLGSLVPQLESLLVKSYLEDN
jgi:ABC-type Fe3+ transport system substrate-binding protein